MIEDVSYRQERSNNIFLSDFIFKTDAYKKLNYSVCSLEFLIGSKGISSLSFFVISFSFSLFIIWDCEKRFKGNISFTWVIVRVVESTTLYVLSFDAIPERATGITNLTFFGGDTIETLFSSIEFDKNWLSAVVMTLFSVQNWYSFVFERWERFFIRNRMLLNNGK